jgi:PRTRC genetic system protein B
MNNLLQSPPDALGALFFLPGQYLFKTFEAGRETTKALSSEQISRAFRDYRVDSGWITRRILRYREEPEGNYILSYEPAGQRTIFVEQTGGEVEEITLPLPTLILFGHRSDFYLWATKSKMVNPKSKLCAAPLPNIGGNSSGKICFGKSEVPEARVETLDAVWKLIFQTPFNRDHSTNKCQSEPKDVRKLLFALAKKNVKRFPNSDLLEINATVADLWAQAVKNT